MPRPRKNAEKARQDLINASGWRERAEQAEAKADLLERGIMASLSGMLSVADYETHCVTSGKACRLLRLSKSPLLRYEARGLLTTVRGSKNQKLYQPAQLLNLFGEAEHA